VSIGNFLIFDTWDRRPPRTTAYASKRAAVKPRLGVSPPEVRRLDAVAWQGAAIAGRLGSAGDGGRAVTGRAKRPACGCGMVAASASSRQGWRPFCRSGGTGAPIEASQMRCCLLPAAAASARSWSPAARVFRRQREEAETLRLPSLMWYRSRQMNAPAGCFEASCWPTFSPSSLIGRWRLFGVEVSIALENTLRLQAPRVVQGRNDQRKNALSLGLLVVG